MAVDMFLKLDGIDGESTDNTHKGEIELQSFSWGLSNIGSATGGAGAGRTSFQDFHFVKHSDKASPQLFLHCANGKHINEGTLTVRKAGGESAGGTSPAEFMKIKLSDVLVSSFASKDDNNDEVPSESISLNFGKIEFSFMSSDARPEFGGWDLKTNKEIIAI